jgi:hypothetical protein
MLRRAWEEVTREGRGKNKGHKCSKEAVVTLRGNFDAPGLGK